MLAILGGILLAVGLIGSTICGIWILVLAFQKSVVWGLLSLFIPFAVLVFIFQNWDRAGKPFLYSLGFGVLAGVGGAMAGAGLLSMFPTTPPA